MSYFLPKSFLIRIYARWYILFERLLSKILTAWARLVVAKKYFKIKTRCETKRKAKLYNNIHIKMRDTNAKYNCNAVIYEGFYTRWSLAKLYTTRNCNFMKIDKVIFQNFKMIEYAYWLGGSDIVIYEKRKRAINRFYKNG